MDPNNEDQLEKINQFEQEHGIPPDSSICLHMAKQADATQRDNNTNEINQVILFQESGKVKDYCLIQGVKDMKMVTASLAPIKTKNREILDFLPDYVFRVLGIEELFISFPSYNKDLEEQLKTRGYESLGEENKIVTYIKEKQKESEITDYEINKKY